MDATAGNGYDTLFLARLIGEEGRVHAFDIQQQALDNTRALLSQAGLEHRVNLYLDSHSNIPHWVAAPVQAVMFNLGYLPGGERSLVTSPQETLAALQGSVEVLGKGGIISVVTYSGHPEGKKEEEAVAIWCNQLNPGKYTILALQVLNKEGNPPRLWLIKG